MDRLLIGIDSGGARTFVLARHEQRPGVTFEKIYPAGNIHSIGVEATRIAFTTLVNDLRGAFGHELDRAMMVVGSAGVDSSEDVNIYNNLIRGTGFEGGLMTMGNGYIALVGGNGRREGALINCGTGSICIGIDKEGREVRTGGWGYLLGDEGSGYNIGMSLIKAVCRAYDQDLPSSKITNEVLTAIGAKSVPDIINVIYSSSVVPVSAIASLSPIAMKNYNSDNICKGIVDREIDGIMINVDGLVAKMQQSEFDMSVCGNQLTHSPLYFDLLKKRLRVRYPLIRVQRPLFTPAEGALIIAQTETELQNIHI